MAAKRGEWRMSERAEQIYEFIKQYHRDRGVAPSFREIGDACHISSTSVVRYWLDILVAQGKIKHLAGVARGIKILEVDE